MVSAFSHAEEESCDEALEQVVDDAKEAELARVSG